MIGKHLAHYEVLGLVGKGGMGEVYRARDTKLDREVALKVLPREMSHDSERIARFEREARTLATLQHPNVASVYGFEETPEARFLVMELVEGEDLAERLRRGAIPVDEAIEIARQLTEGLEAAHERNIVHRDLKPANIKVDPDGVVKILDFGLARAYIGDVESQDDLEHSPTITAAMTQAGTILGTAAYMSPEQAKGKTVDKRADIWAFGAIIYEMLTGRRLFEAETVSETLAGVLLIDIDWDALPAETPASLRVLLERCLQKDPKLRLRDVGEARIVLADPTATIAMRAAVGASVDAGPGRPRWPWIVGIAAALAVGLLAGRALVRPGGGPELPALLFDIPDPTNTLVTGSLALSPNGEHLVFARRDSLGTQELWIRRMDEDEPRRLQGSRDGRLPFWSADGTKVGFFIADSVFRTSLDGGAASQIASFPHRPMGGSWNADDLILVGTNEGPIYSVTAGGGNVQAVTEVELGVEESHCWPRFLPDGEHFVFLSDASTDEGHRLWVSSLDGSERKILMKGVRSEIFVDFGGALLLCIHGQLFAQPFDFSRREFSGPQVLVQDQLQPFGERHETMITLSNNGVLAFQRGSDESVISRVPLDGSDPEPLLEIASYRNPRLSPDGNTLAYEIQESSDQRLIWAQDLTRGTRTLVSERGASSDSAVWSPDGQAVYYGSSVSGTWQVYRKDIYGGSGPELIGIPEGCDDVAALDCSFDGEWLLVSGNTQSMDMDLYLGKIDGEATEWIPWLSSPAREHFARLSPDARWIAYESDASGRMEIYVAPREGGPQARRWLVSVNGGFDPAFSRDGKSLYYRSPNGFLMEVPVTATGDRIEFGLPARRVDLPAPRVGYLRNLYDPTLDGRAVIAFQPVTQFTPAIRVRTGWREW